MRIAIIGGGISGLVAAYKLADDHAITLFEANGYLGGHTNTVNVTVDDEKQAIDTGFIVFNDRTYPNFQAILAELGVATKPTVMSFSVSDGRTGLEYNGHSLNALFAQRRNLVQPSFYRMLADVLRFNRLARKRIEACDDTTSVREFLSQQRFSREFIDHYLLPMGSAIWSCPREDFLQFPIRFIVDFFTNHGLLSILGRPTWHVVEGGSQTYVRAIIRKFANRVRLITPVESVRRTADGIEVCPRHMPTEPFDQVIFACHSDQALRILGSGATGQERELLSAFPYVRNIAVLHTDMSLLPKSRRAWASWNYRLRGDGSSPASVTYNMNILQGLRSRHTYCVTLNDEAQIAPDQILGKYVYHHPTFDQRRSSAQARHGELLNANRTSFCGAYWRNGFHEDGVVSALAVVNAIQGKIPLHPTPFSESEVPATPPLPFQPAEFVPAQR